MKFDGTLIDLLKSSRPVPYVESGRSEEHTSELQSLAYLVCRLLLEKKKKEEDHSPVHLPLISALDSIQFALLGSPPPHAHSADICILRIGPTLATRQSCPPVRAASP